jgi:drug/metabolite transporter (DMT)-like permease
MERERMSYGLLSALSWGISTLLAAVAARRIGALRTVVTGEAAGLAGYLTLFLVGHFSLRGVGGSVWLLVLAGVVAVAGYLAMYRGLESGHVGLVSAISACYGGVIAVLSVVLLREHLTIAAVAGIAATVVGVMLAVTRRAPARASSAPNPGTLTPGIQASGIQASGIQNPGIQNLGRSAGNVGAPAVGVAFGLVAALCYGVGGFMIGRYSLNLGWLVPVVVARGGAMVILLGLLATPLRGPAGTPLTAGLA